MNLNSDAGLSKLKNLIASGNLAIIGVDADKYSGLTSADVWTLDSYINPDVNHANTIVGYDDSISYTENGTTQYGAFKVANSWGVGGWEKDPDGFYWISYETMKQRIGYCMFYYDMLITSLNYLHLSRSAMKKEANVTSESGWEPLTSRYLRKVSVSTWMAEPFLFPKTA
jgi:C1A family cysteine protease